MAVIASWWRWKPLVDAAIVKNHREWGDKPTIDPVSMENSTGAKSPSRRTPNYHQDGLPSPHRLRVACSLPNTRIGHLLCGYLGRGGLHDPDRRPGYLRRDVQRWPPRKFPPADDHPRFGQRTARPRAHRRTRTGAFASWPDGTPRDRNCEDAAPAHVACTRHAIGFSPIRLHPGAPGAQLRRRTRRISAVWAGERWSIPPRPEPYPGSQFKPDGPGSR